MAEIDVKVKDARTLFFKLRSRFQKLEGQILGNALMEASEPLVAAAQGFAPVLSSAKRGRTAGQLRSRIAPTLRRRGTRVIVDVSPIRLSRGDKYFPFYGKFQELGWRATGRAKRGTAKRSRPIAGKHFLKRAGEASFSRVEAIFAKRVLEGFAAAEGGND